jgi:hypothetical protein
VHSFIDVLSEQESPSPRTTAAVLVVLALVGLAWPSADAVAAEYFGAVAQVMPVRLVAAVVHQALLVGSAPAAVAAMRESLERAEPELLAVDDRRSFQ